MIRLLFLGDVVGEPGRKAVIGSLSRLKEEWELDFTVVNGENAAGGRGITPKICIDLMRAGAAVVTTGDHVWDQREIVPFLDTEPRLLRPVNYPEGTPGQGWIVLGTAKGPVGVVNVQTRTFMQPILDNPFRALDQVIETVRAETPVVFVDVHGETTSEKIAIGRYLDGRVSAVVGTHTHVQTADETVFPNGTAFLCDAGMCGAQDSILGRVPGPIIKRFLDNMPAAFPIAKADVWIKGALVEIDESSGRTLRIQRVSEPWTPETVAEPLNAPGEGEAAGDDGNADAGETVD